MFTRKEYLDCGRGDQDARAAAFRRYYGEIIDAAGGPEAFRNRLPVDLGTIRIALAEDHNLNTIPLARWSAAAVPVPAKAAAAMRERGDYPTLAGAVSILKEAARRLAEGS